MIDFTEATLVKFPNSIREKIEHKNIEDSYKKLSINKRG